MLRLIACVLTAVMLTLPGCGRVDNPTEISAVFREYQQAVAARDGEAAANLIAAPTREEYETLRDLALSAEETDLRQQRASYQLMALLLRQFSAPELDEQVDGRTVFAIFVNHAAIPDEGSQRQLSMFTFSGENASAQLQIDGQLTRRRIHFVREDQRWRIDLRARYADDDKLEAAARQAQLPLGDYLVGLVGEMTGQTPREDLWRPLQ